MVAPEWPPTTVTFSFAGSVPLISEMKRLARTTDRKSTRLNSSHSQISYAVFCLKKKKINHREAGIHFSGPLSRHRPGSLLVFRHAAVHRSYLAQALPPIRHTHAVLRHTAPMHYQ